MKRRSEYNIRAGYKRQLTKATKEASLPHIATPIAQTTFFLHPSTGVALPTDAEHWNSLYQDALELPQNPNSKFFQREQTKKMGSLVNRFVLFAQQVAEVIVAERKMDDETRSLHPDNTKGGAAGGEKFTYGNILFKFAYDWQTIYGSDALAVKAAANEVTAMNALVCTRIHGLHTALSALFLVNGTGVIATAIAPIGEQTLVLGTANAGESIKDGAEYRPGRDLVKRLAATLNLGPHYFTDDSNFRAQMYGPVDMEGHRGKDGRFYCVDLARLCPPVPPRDNKDADIFCRLFRPEFLQSACHDLTLCSDSFSDFVQEDFKEYEDRAERAHSRLLATVIPVLAADLEFSCPSAPGSPPLEWSSSFISKTCHRHGVNIRYLAAVYQHVKSNCKDVRLRLQLEIVCRCVKTVVRANISTHSDRSSYLKSVLRFIFQDFSQSKSDDCCQQKKNFFLKLGEVAQEKFGDCVSQAEWDLLWRGTEATLLLAITPRIMLQQIGLVAKLEGSQLSPDQIVRAATGCDKSMHLQVTTKCKVVQLPPFLTPTEAGGILRLQLDNRESVLGSTHHGLLPSLYGLLEHTEELGFDGLAIGQEYVDRILHIHNNHRTADGLDKISSFFSHFQCHEKAVQYMRVHIEEIRQEMGDSIKYARGLSRLAIMESELPDTEANQRAKDIFEACMPLFSQLDMKPLLHVPLTGLSECFNRAGDTKKALSYAKQALAAVKECMGDDHPLVAHLLVRVQDITNPDKKKKPRLNGSQKKNKEAKIISETAHGHGVSNCLDSLSPEVQYEKQMLRAIAILEYNHNPKYVDLAPILLRLGKLYRQLGLRDKGVEVVRRALDILQQAYGSGSTDTQTAVQLLEKLTQ